MSDQTDLVRRLRGQYGIGPTLPNGEPEMGYRQFDRLPPIHGEAATEIERLRERVASLEKELAAVAEIGGRQFAELTTMVPRSGGSEGL